MVKFKTFLEEQAGKGLTMFDVDETMFITKAKVKVMKNGKVVKKLDNQQFNTYKKKAGEEYDFGEFKDAKVFNRTSTPIARMINKVKVILKKQTDTTENNELVEFGPIKLNLDAHEVLINDDEIILTALEFKLLKHLVQRRGRVQTRDQLLGDVWGYSSEITTRTVDTHIKRLREKLGTVGDYIQTVRGVGYRLNNQS